MTRISAKLIGLTQPIDIDAKTPEEFIAYAARVSNPSNQKNVGTASGLLRYCIRNKHWSPFRRWLMLSLHVNAPSVLPANFVTS
jgi:thymidylate synthase (FAD)